MKHIRRIRYTPKAIFILGLFVFICFISIPAMASDRFVNNSDGTITDTKTGLMWPAVDNGNHINWANARSYCQSYKGGNHTDWRMPTLEELNSLYDQRAVNKGGYHINPLISTTSESCWAIETRGDEAARFNFRYGQRHWLRQSHSGAGRALPVRGGN